VGYIKVFTPSKTNLGKLITTEFLNDITSILIGIVTDEKLTSILLQ